MFPTGQGGPIDSSVFRRAWLKIVRRAGCPALTFHGVRHAHASLLLLQGTHAKVVSERLGHSSIRVTMDLYSHVLPGLQAEAAAQLDRLIRPASGGGA